LNDQRIFVNGSIYTADALGSSADAVAVRDGRILAVGTDQEILAAFPDAATVDLGGRTTVPGFIDPHCHYLATGESLISIDLRYPGVASVGDMVAAVAASAAETPAGEWINGAGFDHAKYDTAPTRWDLDRATTEHPVGLMHVSGHYLLVNSLALAGIDDDTPDPKGGRIERDANGRVTGLCQDSAQGLVRPVAVDIGSHGTNFHVAAPMDELVAAIERAGTAYLAAGLTTVADAQVTKREMAAYREARRRGTWWVRTACMPLSHQLEEYGALGLAGPFGDDMLWIGPMKFYMDGSMIGGSMVVEAHRQGWQIGIHAQGDRAIEIVLDAFQAAIEAYPRPDPRHRIEHAGYPTPALLKRMAELGVIAVNQPSLLVDSGDEFLARLGERGEWLQPMRAEAEAGVRFVLSSDSDVCSYRPLDTIAAAVLRRTLGGDVIGADQVITVAEAVRAHTIDAAYSLFAEDRLGSIEPGKYADLTVIDGDLFEVPPEQISDLGIWMTVLDGRVVHDPSGAAAPLAT